MNEFDLSAFEAAETAILEVKDITGEGPLLFNGEPVTIEVFGPGSEQAVKADAEIARANQARMFAAVRGKEPKDAAGEARAGQIRKLVACTKAINNFPIPGGAKALFENPRLGYIAEQFAAFQAAWANFPPKSAKS
jgi:hypothetical protein